MSRIGVLTKYFIKTSFEDMFGGKSKLKGGLMALLLVFVMFLFSIPISIMVSSAYEPLKFLGQEKLLISLILLFSISVTFFFGMFTILNTFYFSNDIECLLPLPFKGEEIVFGKFVSVMINILLYAFIGLFPLITYGIKSGAGIFYYIYMILIVLVLPVFPMIIVTSICVVLMRFTNFSKHKDTFKIIGGCLSLILVVAFNFYSHSRTNSDGSAVVKMLSNGDNNLVSRISGIFITNKFATFALDKSGSIQGFGYLIATILISVCVFIIFYIIVGKIYLRSIIGNIESYGRRKDISDLEGKKNVTMQKSQVYALVMRDIKVILRTPQFFMNAVAMQIYMPLIFGASFIINNRDGSFIAKLNNGSLVGTLFAAVFLASALFISSGGAATYALSREGKDFMISKYIPVSYTDHLHSKIISSICVNQIETIIVAIMLIVLKINPILIIFSVIIAVATIISISFFGLYLDFKSPRLEWEDEKTMMKNNFFPLLVMFSMLIIGGLLVVLSFFVGSGAVMFIIILALCFVICYVFYKLLLKEAKKVYQDE